MLLSQSSMITRSGLVNQQLTVTSVLLVNNDMITHHFVNHLSYLKLYDHHCCKTMSINVNSCTRFNSHVNIMLSIPVKHDHIVTWNVNKRFSIL